MRNGRSEICQRSANYVVWADGIYLEARLEDEKQCILVLIGATPEGQKELVGFTDGAGEKCPRFDDEWRTVTELPF
jgi:transposase-like protein